MASARNAEVIDLSGDDDLQQTATSSWPRFSWLQNRRHGTAAEDVPPLMRIGNLVSSKSSSQGPGWTPQASERPRDASGAELSAPDLQSVGLSGSPKSVPNFVSLNHSRNSRTSNINEPIQISDDEESEVYQMHKMSRTSQVVQPVGGKVPQPTRNGHPAEDSPRKRLNQSLLMRAREKRESSADRSSTKRRKVDAGKFDRGGAPNDQSSMRENSRRLQQSSSYSDRALSSSGDKSSSGPASATEPPRTPNVVTTAPAMQVSSNAISDKSLQGNQSNALHGGHGQTDFPGLSQTPDGGKSAHTRDWSTVTGTVRHSKGQHPTTTSDYMVQTPSPGNNEPRGEDSDHGRRASSTSLLTMEAFGDDRNINSKSLSLSNRRLTAADKRRADETFPNEHHKDLERPPKRSRLIDGSDRGSVDSFTADDLFRSAQANGTGQKPSVSASTQHHPDDDQGYVSRSSSYAGEGANEGRNNGDTSYRVENEGLTAVVPNDEGDTRHKTRELQSSSASEVGQVGKKQPGPRSMSGSAGTEHQTRAKIVDSDNFSRQDQQGKRTIHSHGGFRTSTNNSTAIRAALSSGKLIAPVNQNRGPASEIFLHNGPDNDPGLSKFSMGKKVEVVLQKHLKDFRSDNIYWTHQNMRRARNMVPKPLVDSSGAGPTSFAAIKPLQPAPATKGSSPSNVWGIEKISATARPISKSSQVFPYLFFSTDHSDEVPDYAHYVSIKNNILAPNVTTLHCWPYFGDNVNSDELNLDIEYSLDIIERERKITSLLKAQQYQKYADKALCDLDCNWADVLRFLLAKQPEIGPDEDAQKAFQDREKFCLEDFSRTAPRWIKVLNGLPPSDPERLARVALLCDAFQKQVNFPLWHIARRSDYCKLPEQKAVADTQDGHEDFTCRMCLRFDCPYHGELKENADSEGESIAPGSKPSPLSASERVVATDIINPPQINRRMRVSFPKEPWQNAAGVEDFIAKKKSAQYWASGNFRKADERGPFYPCHHPGSSCEDARCSCFKNRVTCEKACTCAPNCSRKFQGCSCSTKTGRKLVCSEDPDCACYQTGRECDPDLCGTCGVCEVVDPVNRRDDTVLRGKCHNASIQRGVVKHTLLGSSGVHGLGLYACEDIAEHDFVGEYVGEIITKKEADRRGAVYEHQQLSYLFSLNTAQEIDSTYFGNKTRFINHVQAKKANLRARITLVNTVHRIALYAERPIKSGEELLFDYGPKFPDEQLGGTKSRKSAPHVRNANLVKSFYDVAMRKDEHGNSRAEKIAKASDRSTGTKEKALNSGRNRGGGRPANSKSNRKGLPPHAASNASHGNTSSDEALETTQNAGDRLNQYNVANTNDDTDHVEIEEEGDDAFEPSVSEDEESADEDIESSADEVPSTRRRQGRRRD